MIERKACKRFDLLHCFTSLMIQVFSYIRFTKIFHIVIIETCKIKMTLTGFYRFGIEIFERHIHFGLFQQTFTSFACFIEK